MARGEIRAYPLDLDPDVAVGLALQWHELQGTTFEVTYTTIEQAKTNVLCLLLTNQGERVMQPEFGCGLYKTLFEPITDALLNDMTKIVEDQIATWLPYLDLVKVKFIPEHDQNMVNLYIEFALKGNPEETQSVTVNVNTA